MFNLLTITIKIKVYIEYQDALLIQNMQWENVYNFNKIMGNDNQVKQRMFLC